MSTIQRVRRCWPGSLLGLLFVGWMLMPQAVTGAGKSNLDPYLCSSPPPTAVRISEESIKLSTFPYERYQSPAFDPLYAWPYQRFDYERFRAEAPQPELRSYRALVLENEYLKVTVLPELGGRIWRVVHKPSGNDLFYHNSTVMPSPWGPGDMRGWFGVGGLEWDLPVAEHGYAWGTPWQVTAFEVDGQTGTVELTLPQDGRTLGATIRISLPADTAAFSVTTTLTNLSQQPVRFAYWNSAALAPGKDNRPSAGTHFVLPTADVTVHSTDDKTLPGPSHTMSWPVFNGRDLSSLATWDQYLGAFERPAAHGPFTAVYDRLQDAGGVRVFPANIARGSKIFGLGWRDALDGGYYANDGSSYVELHGGLAPTFADQVALPAGGEISWTESWYPVDGIGDLRYANGAGAVNWQRTDEGLSVGFYPTRAFEGMLIVSAAGKAVARQPVTARPDLPYRALLKSAALRKALKSGAPLTLQIEDSGGTVLLAANESTQDH